MTTRFHLAQANIARLRAPITDPLLADFVAKLDSVNAEADRFPGFVWRLQTEEGDATGVRVLDDDRILFNMSAWESIEAFKSYVYSGGHLEVFRSRSKWFEPSERSSYCMWWIPAGEIPDVAEGIRRLEMLWSRGPSPDSFSFKEAFAPPL